MTLRWKGLFVRDPGGSCVHHLATTDLILQGKTIYEILIEFFQRERMSIENTESVDQLAWTLLDLMLILVTSSTLAYEVVLFSRLPLWTCYVFFLLHVGILLFVWIQLNLLKKLGKIDTSMISMAGLCLFSILLNIFILRPNAEDLIFFHRALHGIQNMGGPISIFHTALDSSNLPALSPVHLTTAIEVMGALFARALGLQPLFFCQIITGCFFLFFFPLVFYVFFRYFDFSYRNSFLGVVIIILLYICSGDSHQDWGQFTIVRAWQGKCILILLFVPLTALLTFRFMDSGSVVNLLRLFFAAICSIGLSGTAFFLVPFVIASTALGSFLSQWNQPQRTKKIILLATTLVPFAIIVGLIKLGYLPELTNTDVWQQFGWRHIVNAQLRPEYSILADTLFLKTTTLFFYFASLAGILLWPWKNQKITQVAIASLLVSFCIVFPPISSILLKITLLRAYWRLAYATQMLLVIAVFILLCLDSEKVRGRFLKPTMKIFGILFLTLFAILKSPVVTSAVIARPHQWKLKTSHIQVVQLLKNRAPDHSLALIPAELLSAVGLLRPDIAFVSVSPIETLHVFSNTGRKDEAGRRIAAQNDLTTCGAAGKISEILAEVPQINIFIFPNSCETQLIEKKIQLHQEEWDIQSTANYQVWLKNAHK